jgi:hypothetical protein
MAHVMWHAAVKNSETLNGNEDRLRRHSFGTRGMTGDRGVIVLLSLSMG